MFEIRNNKIRITRGDTGIFVIDILDRITDLPYNPESDDKVRFTVKKSQYRNQPLIYKEGTQIMLDPIDTLSLPYGKYLYDVEITLANGMVQTIIEPNEFEVTSEVTWLYDPSWGCESKTDIANQSVVPRPILNQYDNKQGVKSSQVLIGTLYIPKVIGEEEQTNDYNKLLNKPMVNTVTLVGDRSFADLGMIECTNLQIDELFANNE